MTDYAVEYGHVVRYSAEDAKGFHQAMNNSPSEHTTHLVYADWLQDHGKEAHSEVVRKNIEHQTIANQPVSYFSTARNFGHLAPGQFGFMRDNSYIHGEDGQPALTLVQKSLADPDQIIWWVHPVETFAQRTALAKRLIAEGAVHLAEEDITDGASTGDRAKYISSRKKRQ